jgi:hypothetical protein
MLPRHPDYWYHFLKLRSTTQAICTKSVHERGVNCSTGVRRDRLPSGGGANSVSSFWRVAVDSPVRELGSSRVGEDSLEESAARLWRSFRRSGEQRESALCTSHR